MATNQALVEALRRSEKPSLRIPPRSKAKRKKARDFALSGRGQVERLVTLAQAPVIDVLHKKLSFPNSRRAIKEAGLGHKTKTLIKHAALEKARPGVGVKRQDTRKQGGSARKNF